MMKTHNKKRGFTIVELVIVIAVIAILSAVMVPTFTGIVKKAKESAAMQEANSAARAVAGTYEEGTVPSVDGVDAYVVIKEKDKATYWIEVEGNKIGDPNAVEDGVVDIEDVILLEAGAEIPDSAEVGDKVYRAHAEDASVYVFERILTAEDIPTLE